MLPAPLSPLRFEPIFKSALWGGTQLKPFFGQSDDGSPIGEAWVLSDQGTNCSRVAEGALQGASLRELLQQHGQAILGDQYRAGPFPLLLKFIDAAKPLSIQVHPTDQLARELEPTSPSVGKTEAWVILKAATESKLFAGLRVGTTVAELERSKDESPGFERFVEVLTPNAGDCYFLPAGMVHAIGAGLFLFEVQQTSDITYRLSDWGRIDPVTGQPRELHWEKGLKCINHSLGSCPPVRSTPLTPEHERLVSCRYFNLDRWTVSATQRMGEADRCRVLVGIGGQGTLLHGEHEYRIYPGVVWLLPACVGAVLCVPDGPLTLLECGLPE